MNNNTYGETESSSLYPRTHPYIQDEQLISNITDFLSKIINEHSSHQNYDICDIGCGSGEIDIALIKYNKTKINLFYCIDSSEVMLAKFSENMRRLPLNYLKKFVLLNHDFNLGFPKALDSFNFDSILAFSSLHHLTNIEHSIIHILKKLKKNGLFILAYLSGDYEPINCNFTNRRNYESNKSKLNFLKFWQTYFQQKEKYFKWKPKYKATDYSYIIETIKNIGELKKIESRSFNFTSDVNFNVFITWIEHGLLTGIKIGINKSQKAMLSNFMRIWLNNNNLINKKYTMNLTYNFHVFKKSVT